MIGREVVVAVTNGGLLCGLMTRMWFSPPGNARLYQGAVRVTAVVYGMLAVALAVRLISTSGAAPPITTLREALILYVGPALLAGVAGFFISRRVADWYLQERVTARGSAAEGPFGVARPA